MYFLFIADLKNRCIFIFIIFCDLKNKAKSIFNLNLTTPSNEKEKKIVSKKPARVTTLWYLVSTAMIRQDLSFNDAIQNI
tara:strand:+ start:412 stop:651 length:240 start_codon:yes stop_codon:yes gene_type:complete